MSFEDSKVQLILFLIFLILFSLVSSRNVLAQTCYGCTGTCCCENPAGCPEAGCPMCRNYGCVDGYEQRCCDDVGCWYQCCGGCFPGETRIEARSEEGEGGSETKKIEDLEPGDVVSSFNPETGEISESVVEDISQRTAEGYYILETESGKKIKVTAEHPFLAVKAKNNQAPSSKLQTTFGKVGDIFSQTLTYRLLTGLQAKITEILD